MAITVIQGRASNIRQSAETHGGFTGGTGRVDTLNAASFRIDNRSVVFKSTTGADICAGDLVTAAGEDSGGSFRAIALRNDSTKAVYNSPGAVILACSALLVLVSLPLCFVLIGIPLAAFSIYGVWIGLKGVSANGALAAAPIPTGLPVAP